MMRLAATTTAWGDGDSLDVVLARIADHDPEVEVVELSIGARPVRNPADVLAAWRDRFEFVGHHTCPVGRGSSLMPGLSTNPAAAASLLAGLGIRRYSAHPPHRNRTDAAGMWRWAASWHEALAERGVSFAVETMYTPRTRDEEALSGGYFLSTPAEVWEFAERACSTGWQYPLLLDASHLHIGWRGGGWSEQDVVELLADGPADELHISTNDGRRDLHEPLTGGEVVSAWVEPVLARFELVVDEGRRRGAEVPHVVQYAAA